MRSSRKIPDASAAKKLHVAATAAAPRLRIPDPRVRRIVIERACASVARGIVSGAIPKDAEAVREATRRACSEEWFLYKAAEEFVRG